VIARQLLVEAAVITQSPGLIVIAMQ